MKPAYLRHEFSGAQLFYLEMGTSEMLHATCKNLHLLVELVADGVSIDLRNGVPLEGIALLNIPSIYGGSNLWGEQSRATSGASGRRGGGGGNGSGFESEGSVASQAGTSPGAGPAPLPAPTPASSRRAQYAQQSMGDGLLEVVGLEGTFHVGQVRAGLQSGRRLAQCRDLIIRTRRRMPMQIDGEPWIQPPALIHVSMHNQVPMVAAQAAAKRPSLFSLFTRRS